MQCIGTQFKIMLGHVLGIGLQCLTVLVLQLSSILAGILAGVFDLEVCQALDCSGAPTIL